MERLGLFGLMLAGAGLIWEITADLQLSAF